LTEKISSEFGQLKALTGILLDLTFISPWGSIPKALSNCTHLKWIQIPYNSLLRGTIPTEFDHGKGPLHCTPLAGLIFMDFCFEIISQSTI